MRRRNITHLTRLEQYKNHVQIEEVDEERHQELSDCTWQEFEDLLDGLSESYNERSTNDLIVSLSRLDGSLKAKRLDEYPEIVNREIQHILTELSMCDLPKLRERSWTCLSTLCAFFTGFLEYCNLDEIAKSISMNLSEEVSVTTRHIFRFIGHALPYPQFLDALAEYVTVDDLYSAAIEYLSVSPDKVVIFMFYRISQLDEINPELLEKCTFFFYFFLKSPTYRNIKGVTMVLVAVDTLLSSSMIPDDAKYEVINTLQLDTLLPAALTGLGIYHPRKRLFGWLLILGDLISLGLSHHNELIPMLLGAIYRCTTDWQDDPKVAPFHDELLESLLVIIDTSDPEISDSVWVFNDYVLPSTLLTLMENGEFRTRKVAARIIMSLILEMSPENVIEAIRPDIFDGILDFVVDRQLYYDVCAECIDRSISCATDLHQEQLLREVLMETCCCEKFTELADDLDDEILHAFVEHVQEFLSC